MFWPNGAMPSAGSPSLTVAAPTTSGRGDDVDALAHEYRALVDDRHEIADDLAAGPGDGVTAEQWWTTG